MGEVVVIRKLYLLFFLKIFGDFFFGDFLEIFWGFFGWCGVTELGNVSGFVDGFTSVC